MYSSNSFSWHGSIPRVFHILTVTNRQRLIVVQKLLVFCLDSEKQWWLKLAHPLFFGSGFSKNIFSNISQYQQISGKCYIAQSVLTMKFWKSPSWIGLILRVGDSFLQFNGQSSATNYGLENLGVCCLDRQNQWMGYASLS